MAEREYKVTWVVDASEDLHGLFSTKQRTIEYSMDLRVTESMFYSDISFDAIDYDEAMVAFADKLVESNDNVIRAKVSKYDDTDLWSTGYET